MIKPLENKETQAKRRHRNNVMIGIIIAAIMIVSSVGFAILESQQNQEQQGQKTYRNYNFYETSYGWQTTLKINEQSFVINTVYLPQELENVTSQGKPLLQDFMDKTLVLVASSDDERSAASEFSALQDIVTRFQPACSQEQENSSYCQENNLPVKGCDNASFQEMIVMLQESNETSVNYKNSCLVIKGKGSELIKATEKSIFMIFGIME